MKRIITVMCVFLNTQTMRFQSCFGVLSHLWQG